MVIWWSTGYAAECVPNLSACVSRLQRPNVYLPVHLYGQLVHDKTGCHLLEAQVNNSSYFLAVPLSKASFSKFIGEQWLCRFSSCSNVCLQSVVPDLSYTVRSPMLDTWEGIKQLKAALWALVSITRSQFMPPQLLVTIILMVTKRWLWLLLLFFFSGQHWLFKLGSESPAGGECHSRHPRTGSALWGAVSTRVSMSFSVFTPKKYPGFIFVFLFFVWIKSWTAKYKKNIMMQ